jgi:hypothetical protein
MEELDYFKVMEKRIQYFSRKYDPYSRYVCDTIKQQQKILNREALKPSKRKSMSKVKESFKQVVAMFL